MRDREEYVYGINTIRSLLGAYPADVVEVLLSRDRRDSRVREVLELAGIHSVRVHSRPNDALTRLAGTHHHQGMVAVVTAFQYTELDEIVSRLDNEPAPLLVALDGVQDPGNLGAVVRSAFLLEATAVLVPTDRAAGVTPGARKASAGAAAHIPIVRVVNLARTIVSTFEQKGIWWVGLDQNAGKDLTDLDLTVPTGLVVGGEERGLRELTRKRCQHLARIPGRDGASASVDSLNVAASAAIGLYEVSRQRRAASRQA